MHTYYITAFDKKNSKYRVKANSIEDAFAIIFDMRGCYIMDTYLIYDTTLIGRVEREDNENGNMLWCAAYVG